MSIRAFDSEEHSKKLKLLFVKVRTLLQKKDHFLNLLRLDKERSLNDYRLVNMIRIWPGSFLRTSKEIKSDLKGSHENTMSFWTFCLILWVMLELSLES